MRSAGFFFFLGGNRGNGPCGGDYLPSSYTRTSTR
jgi:hypothetical protein